MTYTPGEIIAMGSVIVAVVGAFGAVIVNIIVSLKTQQQVRDVNTKADAIAANVNGAATAAAAREEALRREIEIIREVMAERKINTDKRESANLAAITTAIAAQPAKAPGGHEAPQEVIVKNETPIPVKNVPK